MKKTTVAAAMLFALCANVAYADDPATINEGSGDITFVGSIIDAPCSISPDSVNQTIQMGQVSNATLEKYLDSRMVDFDIKLVGCNLKTANSVEITFTGQAAAAPHTDKLILSSAASGASIPASGAALQIFNKQSGAIELGKATKVTDLYTFGDNTLSFGAKLVKTATDITLGEFDAKAHFVMQYQ